MAIWVWYFEVIVIGLSHVSDNPLNGEGVGYLYAARYWESFTIDSKIIDSIERR